MLSQYLSAHMHICPLCLEITLSLHLYHLWLLKLSHVTSSIRIYESYGNICQFKHSSSIPGRYITGGEKQLPQVVLYLYMSSIACINTQMYTYTQININYNSLSPLIHSLTLVISPSFNLFSFQTFGCQIQRVSVIMYLFHFKFIYLAVIVPGRTFSSKLLLLVKLNI